MCTSVAGTRRMVSTVSIRPKSKLRIGSFELDVNIIWSTVIWWNNDEKRTAADQVQSCQVVCHQQCLRTEYYGRRKSSFRNADNFSRKKSRVDLCSWSSINFLEVIVCWTHYRYWYEFAVSRKRHWRSHAQSKQLRWITWMTTRKLPVSNVFAFQTNVGACTWYTASYFRHLSQCPRYSHGLDWR